MRNLLIILIIFILKSQISFGQEFKIVPAKETQGFSNIIASNSVIYYNNTIYVLEKYQSNSSPEHEYYLALSNYDTSLKYINSEIIELPEFLSSNLFTVSHLCISNTNELSFSLKTSEKIDYIFTYNLNDKNVKFFRTKLSSLIGIDSIGDGKIIAYGFDDSKSDIVTPVLFIYGADGLIKNHVRLIDYNGYIGYIKNILFSSNSSIFCIVCLMEPEKYSFKTVVVVLDNLYNIKKEKIQNGSPLAALSNKKKNEIIVITNTSKDVNLMSANVIIFNENLSIISCFDLIKNFEGNHYYTSLNEIEDKFIFSYIDKRYIKSIEFNKNKSLISSEFQLNGTFDGIKGSVKISEYNIIDILGLKIYKKNEKITKEDYCLLRIGYEKN